MNDPAGVASHVGTLLPPMAGRRSGAIRPAWEPPGKRLSIKDSIRASTFLMFYTAAYMAAGYAGVAFIEWVWMRMFG
jgi:hypothetical protein